jgi:hypothetical protein
MTAATYAMSTYDPYQALQAIDANIGIIAVGMFLALSLTMLYFFEAIRLGVVQKTFSPPLAATLWFLPHDLSFVLLYDRWFNVYDHWWVKIWWLGLACTVAIELFLLGQVVRYGRKELMPQVSQKAFLWWIVAATLAVGVMWAFIKSIIDDELFFASFFFTIVWPIPFTTAQILRRKSQRGASVLQQSCLAPMAFGLALALYHIAPFFRSPLFLALVAVTMIWSLYNIWLLRRQPPYVPEVA